MKNKNRRAIWGIIFVNIMWGLSFIGSKRSMAGGLQPFSLVFVRFLSATLLLFPLAFLTKNAPRIHLRDIPGLILSALFGVTVYFFFELEGLRRTSASTASLLIALIPVFTLVTGLVLHGKRPGRLQWIGAGCSLIGVFMVVYEGAGGTDSMAGVLYMLGACLCWVVYGEVTDRLLKRLPTLTVTCWQSLFSLISLVPPMLIEGTDLSTVTADAWLWACLFLGIICSCVCYILYNDAIALLSPQKTAIFLNLNPLAAVIGGALLLNEKMTPLQIIGGIIILGSLLLVNRGEAKKDEPEKTNEACRNE